MKKIVDNLHRQHKELVRLGTQMIGLLDIEKLATNAHAAHHCMSALTGLLRVHLAMEDRSFYPFLLDHRDPTLRSLASEFLAQRGSVEERYAEYLARWDGPAAIAAAPQRFIDETKATLWALLQRMNQEDQQFHPEVVRRWEDGSAKERG